MIDPALRAAGASLSWVDYASLSVAALAFATSAGFGFLNRRTTKRALAISQRQEARRESHLDIYLIGSRAQRRVEKKDRIIGFEVRISNPSDSPNSAVARSGWLLYRVDDVLAAPAEIDRYELVVQDVHGIERGLPVTILEQAAP
jgi:hypothetical protein